MTEKEFRRDVLPMKEPMYRLAVGMGIPPDDAADVAQECLIKLWRSRDRLPTVRGELRLYCLRVARNEALDQVGRKRRQEGIREVEDVVAPRGRDLEYLDTRERIVELMEQLPGRQGEAMSLSSLGGMSVREVAEAMGESEVNVRQLLSRGRKRIRELFKRNGI